jgi:hypothetical protein
MSYLRKSLANVFAAVIAVMSFTTIAFWQFYLFITFRNSQGMTGMQGGTHHLWVGLGAVTMACAAGLFLFSVFLRYHRGDELDATF